MLGSIGDQGGMEKPSKLPSFRGGGRGGNKAGKKEREGGGSGRRTCSPAS